VLGVEVPSGRIVVKALRGFVIPQPRSREIIRSVSRSFLLPVETRRRSLPHRVLRSKDKRSNRGRAKPAPYRQSQCVLASVAERRPQAKSWVMLPTPRRSAFTVAEETSYRKVQAVGSPLLSPKKALMPRSRAVLPGFADVGVPQESQSLIVLIRRNCN
jgi:hypothetical protein